MVTEAPEEDTMKDAGLKLSEAAGPKKLTIDLSEGRSGDEGLFSYPGDRIIKQKLTGSAEIAFAKPNRYFPLGRYNKLERVGFDRFFIRNEPQPGEELVLHVGGQSDTDVVGGSQPSQLVNTADAVINPATRHGWGDLENDHTTVDSSDSEKVLNNGSSIEIPHGATLRIRALTSNSGIVYVGQNGLTENSGYPLPQGSSITLEVTDVALVSLYVPSGGSAGDGVAWMFERKQ